ncbi:ABC transporter ATP-binding protein [Devosia sp. BK]|uniref:ABC transporter ATP-binding protein n=1 Tax=Devosia sp. BK TaxID=2871706 RepID=UPI00293B26BA|nr:ABC transporter ATP-binding protein [Devosia sp. BK]MDV3251143.1 ABC transporter ATP-binding protein [Devosia sp. BK]
MRNHQLMAAGLHLGYADREIVADLNLTIPSGKLTVIVGANACGKSTVLRGLARLLPPSKGAVYLDGKPIHQMPTREVATLLGVLPQSPIAPDAITVADLVGRGRYPHQGWFRRWTSEDDAAVAEALGATDMADLAGRPVDELSGGQRQRVWIAMALAQETDLLLLDEPTTFLDINHQVEVLDLLTDLVKSRGRTVVVVLHDLNLACRYADHIVAMKSGKIIAEGKPVDVMTEKVVHDVFNMSSRVVLDPVSNTPMIVPIGRHHVEAAQDVTG